MKTIRVEVFTKNEKGKYAKVNEFEQEAIYFIKDMLNFFERKADGEKIKIKKHYTYHEVMDIDVYFDNGYKYSYYDVPCQTGARIDGYELLKGGE